MMRPAGLGAELAASLGLAAGAAVTLAVAAALGIGLSVSYPFATLLWLLPGAALTAWLAWRRLDAASFGPANRITLLRGALALLLLALLGEPATPAAAWFAIVVSIVILLLDGVDGRIARSRGIASRFGARFDMETDALLILFLTLLVWHHDKAGIWVVAGGLLRYLFIAAGGAMAMLRRPLPPSRRRQTVCVVQIVTLLFALSPWFVRPLSAAVALAGLLALVASFAVDVLYLARPRSEDR